MRPGEPGALVTNQQPGRQLFAGMVSEAPAPPGTEASGLTSRRTQQLLTETYALEEALGVLMQLPDVGQHSGSEVLRWAKTIRQWRMCISLGTSPTLKFHIPEILTHVKFKLNGAMFAAVHTLLLTSGTLGQRTQRNIPTVQEHNGCSQERYGRTTVTLKGEKR